MRPTRKHFARSAIRCALALFAWWSQTESAFAAGDTVTASKSFSARFHVPGSAQVRLDFENERNFRLTPVGESFATLVSDGKIYLESLATSATGAPPVAYWIGELRDNLPLSPELIAKRELTPTAQRLRHSAVPPLGQSEWRAPSAVYDVKSANLDRFQLAPTTSQAQAPVRAVVLTTTRWPALANAQHTIASRLPISMDMSVCGSSVQTLIRNWDLALTQEHFAMLASDHGVRLEGTLLPLEKAVKIDRSRSVLDYRTVVKR